MADPKASRMKRLAKEGSWIVVGQIATVVGALVLVRVLTEYLDPAQYGQLALGLTVAGLVNQMVMGGVSNAIGRFYSIAAEKNDLLSYLHSSRRLMAYATAVVVAIALVLLGGLFWLGYSQWMGLAVAALVFSIVSGYNGAFSSIQNAARQRAIVAFHGGLDAWLKILLTLGVVLWLGTSSTEVVIGYTCSSLLITLSQVIFLRHIIPQQQTHTSRHQQWIHQMWAYSMPFSIWGAFTWMQQVSDRWALQTFATTQDVGQYVVVFQLGYAPIGIVTGLAMSFLGPILYQRSGAATDHRRNVSVHRLAWRITGLGLTASALAFLFTLVAHQWLFQHLVAAPFRASSRFLPWVVLAGGVFAAGQMLGVKLASEMKINAQLLPKIGSALVGVALNILGAQYFGAAGSVAALVAFSVIYFLWMAWIAQHRPADINT
jgi:O-antigen/teichoic acid export membrane protein